MTDGSLNAATDALVSMMSDGQQEETQEQETQETQTEEPEIQEEQQEVAETNEDAAEEPQAEYEEVEYEGKRYAVPKELKGAFLMNADYTRKTQDIAKERKELEAERQTLPQKIEQQFQEKMQRLEALLGVAIEEDAKTDWKALLESDPVEYLRRKELAEERKVQLANMQQENQARQQQHLQSVLSAEREKVLEKFPEWKDEKVAEKARTEMKSFLSSHGYSQQEIDGITDHRVLVVIDKALKYDALSKRDLTTKKIEKLPAKVERPGAASENKSNPARMATLKAKQTGSIDDAAAAISQMFR